MTALFRKISQVITILALILAINPFHSTSAQVTGGVWEEIPVGSATNGGISNTPGSGSTNVDLEIAPNSTIYAAWAEFLPSTNTEVYIRRFNGTSWEEVGAGSASGGGISNSPYLSVAPSIGFDSSSRPYIAWTEGSEIYVRRFNGTTWEEVGIGSASGGGISNTLGDSFRPSLAFAPDGAIYVAWREFVPIGITGVYEVYVRRFNGTAWQEAGVGSASGGGVSNLGQFAFTVDLAVAPNGTPYVTWSDISSYEVYVRRFNGTTWEEAGAGSGSGGGVSNSSGQNSLYPSIIATSTGVPYLAWTEQVVGINAEIYVRRFNGVTWEEAGLNSASNGGVSNTATYSENPSLSNAPDGSVYVAWGDGNGGLERIYVRRFDGTTWNEVGIGSASGGGVSISPLAAVIPSIRVSSSNIPYVAWSANTSPLGGTANYEIYVRRFVQAVIPPTPTPISTTPQAVFDPTMSKRVEFDQGILGLPGEMLTWVITVSNPSAVAGNNLLISDTFQPELQIENATTADGVITINGQTVTVNLASLNPNQTVEIRIITSVIASPPNASFTNLATLTGNGVFESAIATLTVPSGLPNTGYPPQQLEMISD